MGNPDMATPPAYRGEAGRDGTGSAQPSLFDESRHSGLRRAIAGYYANRFGVELDPERETIVTLGSKEGLATSPGDHQPRRRHAGAEPQLSIHAFGFIIAGAAIRHTRRPNPRISWRP